MAAAQITKPADTVPVPKVKRNSSSMVDRMKAQLSAAAFKAKITADELTMLETHVVKLKSLLS